MMNTIDSVFGIAGTALNSQLVRMNTTASNLANAATVASSEKDAFRAKRPVFKALLDEASTNAAFPTEGGVKVDHIADDPAAFPLELVKVVVIELHAMKDALGKRNSVACLVEVLGQRIGGRRVLKGLQNSTRPTDGPGQNIQLGR